MRSATRRKESRGRKTQSPRDAEIQFALCRRPRREMSGVPDHVEEGDGAGPALRSEHEIAGPGIIRNVAFSAIPNVEAIQRVIENGQPDSEQLQIKDKRKAGE